ncbi:MAG: radical SAM family heme chaperone HemW [Chitinophagaceae bacterium]
MAGIYIHVPFCKQACYYCNFHFSTSLKGKNAFLTALLKEIDLQKDYLDKEEIATVYFGGGTPSLLTADELNQILDKLHQTFRIKGDAEITLEANPDDINNTSIAHWKQTGVNRFSIGVQSFFEEDLQWMHRAHTAVQASDCIKRVQDAGFNNLTIDLIYGTPTLPDEKWQANVAQAIALNIPHLSCYALTVEPQTALDTLIRKHKMSPVDPDAQARQFLLLMNWMQQAGYEHYEISNFAKPGMRSKHNSSYWQGKKYLGLGPSAHSYNGKERQWNIPNNARYAASLEKGEVPFEKEILTPVQQLNEYIMTALRTAEGIDLALTSTRFGAHTTAQLTKESLLFIQQGTVLNVNEHLILTKEGKLLADGIASDLFFEET